MSKYSLSFTKGDAKKAYEEIVRFEKVLGENLDWKKIKRANGDNIAMIINILQRKEKELGESKVTVADVKNGKKPAGEPVYVSKTYDVMSPSDKGLRLDAGSLDHIKNMVSYYDDCEVVVRTNDIYLNDNTKFSDFFPPLP